MPTFYSSPELNARLLSRFELPGGLCATTDAAVVVFRLAAVETTNDLNPITGREDDFVPGGGLSAGAELDDCHTTYRVPAEDYARRNEYRVFLTWRLLRRPSATDLSTPDRTETARPGFPPAARSIRGLQELSSRRRSPWGAS